MSALGSWAERAWTERARVVTLIAPAGYGKTTTARQLARKWDDYGYCDAFGVADVAEFAARLVEAGMLAAFVARYSRRAQTRIRIDLLDLAVEREGEPVSLQRREFEILASLALQRGGISREWLADRFWPKKETTDGTSLANWPSLAEPLPRFESAIRDSGLALARDALAREDWPAAAAHAKRAFDRDDLAAELTVRALAGVGDDLGAVRILHDHDEAMRREFGMPAAERLHSLIQLPAERGRTTPIR